MAYFIKTIYAGPCIVKLLRIRHDGDPHQEFPTGLYLATVEVTAKDHFVYQYGEVFTRGAHHIFREIPGICASESVHLCIKRGELKEYFK